MKRLLLHICCAPDATVGSERLKADFEVVGFFYNPNIHPRSEYDRRLAAMRTVSEVDGLAFIEGPYDTSSWLEKAKGLEEEPEKGLRCEACIRMRLRDTARLARDRGFHAFAAVLTVSPHKDAAMVNRLGFQASEEFGVEYIPTDLKKKDGFKRSIELSRQYGLYRQDYCGCEFSKKQKPEARSQKSE
jgi:hypothetical protein